MRGGGEGGSVVHFITVMNRLNETEFVIFISPGVCLANKGSNYSKLMTVLAHMQRMAIILTSFSAHRVHRYQSVYPER